MTPDPQPGHGRFRDKVDPQHCDQEVTCMDYPSYCEENETPCPLFNCKRRGTASDTPQPDTGKQPERHCDHECVCRIFRPSAFSWGSPCSVAECESDTRKYLKLPPMEQQIVAVLECEKCIYKRFAANWKNAESHDAALIQRTLDKFLKVIKAEDPQHLGYVDMDSIEAAYIRLRQSSATGKVINHE